MRYARRLVALGAFYCLSLSAADQRTAILNPAIDVGAYLRVASDAAQHRESRRVSEDDFIRMSRAPGTIVLDVRSKEKYDELHVRGAVNLSFPDIAIGRLAQMLPDKNARILIYCNNNFSNAEGPFPSKLPSASLNLPTYITLYDYGYRNVYELGPLIDARATSIEFESSRSAIVTP
jgi:phage shock protein E